MSSSASSRPIYFAKMRRVLSWTFQDRWKTPVQYCHWGPLSWPSSDLMFVLKCPTATLGPDSRWGDLDVAGQKAATLRKGLNMVGHTWENMGGFLRGLCVEGFPLSAFKLTSALKTSLDCCSKATFPTLQVQSPDSFSVLGKLSSDT